MKKSIIKFAQEQLNAGGFNAGTVDGICGDRTLQAVEKAMEKWGNQAPDDWRKWSKKRNLVAYIQMLCKEQKNRSWQNRRILGAANRICL